MSEERIAALKAKIARDGASQFGPRTPDVVELSALYEAALSSRDSQLQKAKAREAVLSEALRKISRWTADPDAEFANIRDAGEVARQALSALPVQASAMMALPTAQEKTNDE